MATYVATKVSNNYETGQTMESEDYEKIIAGLRLSEDVVVTITDASDNVLYTNSSEVDPSGNAAASATFDSVHATAQIVSGGSYLGFVSISMTDSQALIDESAIDFRNLIYEILMVAGLLSILAALCFGLWFSGFFTRPIGKITDVALEIYNGNLSARTQMKGTDELSYLGESFDEMADSIERARKMEVQLTSDVAHELRTPLMAIQTTVEAMIDGVYEPDEEHLSVVDSEVNRLSRLIDAMLRLTRLEGSQRLDLEVNDIGHIVDTVVMSHETFVEDSGLHIECHAEKNVKAICDKDLIRQAVANLISNAIRYTPEGGHIDVYVHKTGKQAVIDVTDTGIGLTPEEKDKVFTRFWRADEGRHRESGGLGIGLTVVNEIVNKHDGQIKVESEKGVGTTFSIILPEYDEKASQNQARAALKAFELRDR